MSFNENAFFDEMILHYLYKRDIVSTKDIESLFGGIFDWQNVNNVISNRNKKTSYIYKGYMNYDDVKQTLYITPSGKTYIENKYDGRRG